MRQGNINLGATIFHTTLFLLIFIILSGKVILCLVSATHFRYHLKLSPVYTADLTKRRPQVLSKTKRYPVNYRSASLHYINIVDIIKLRSTPLSLNNSFIKYLLTGRIRAGKLMYSSSKYRFLEFLRNTFSINSNPCLTNSY